jgi:predicted lipid-binding transport protein (Tim44 family)
VDAFWIKLVVLAVLAALFGLTVWVTPRLFRSSRPGAPDADAPAPGARARGARAAPSPD